MEENGQLFPTEEIKWINVGGVKEIGKSALGHHGNYCSRQDQQMNAKLNRQNFMDKEYIYIVSKHFPQNKY